MKGFFFTKKGFTSHWISIDTKMSACIVFNMFAASSLWLSWFPALCTPANHQAIGASGLSSPLHSNARTQHWHPVLTRSPYMGCEVSHISSVCLFACLPVFARLSFFLSLRIICQPAACQPTKPASQLTSCYLLLHTNSLERHSSPPTIFVTLLTSNSATYNKVCSGY